MSIIDESEVVTNVFFFLDAHKVEIVEALFPHANEDYRNSWYALSPFDFWCRLDLSNRKGVIRLAKKHYHIR